MIIIEEPDASQPSSGTTAQPAPQEPANIPQSPTHTVVGGIQPSEEPAQAPPPLARATSPPEAAPIEGAESPPVPPPSPRHRVGHYLHDLGVVVIPYDDREDARPSYGIKEHVLAGFKVKAIFVNRKHPSDVKCEKDGTLVDHLLRLITNELVGMNYEGSETAIGVANRLYGLAVVKS